MEFVLKWLEEVDKRRRHGKGRWKRRLKIGLGKKDTIDRAK